MPSVKVAEEPPWTNEIGSMLEVVGKVVDDADLNVTYKPIAFESLLRLWLAHAGLPVPTKVQPQESPPVAPFAPGPAPARFQEFLSQFNLTTEDLGLLYDIVSGEVITHNIGSVKSEGQRKLAALIAIMTAQRTGEFRVPRDTHLKACQTFGVTDNTNYAYTMKHTLQDGIQVFTLDENGKDWNVTRPGLAYLSAVAKGLLPAKKEA